MDLEINNSDVQIELMQPGMKSKYRLTIDKFLENDEMKQGYIQSNSMLEAERIWRGLKRHITVDDPIYVSRKGMIVWLIKVSN